MKQLRFWISVLILWLIFFFNVERINSPINIRSYTYMFVAVVATVTIIAPRIQRTPFLVLILAPIPLFLALKAALEHGPWYENLLESYALPVTVTQVSSIILTGLLARQITYHLKEFENVIAGITFSHVGTLPRGFVAEGQGRMYREVKRARRFHRPLAVVALKVNEAAYNVALPRIVKDTQYAMMREYVMASISRVLDENMHDFDTIAVRDNCFILVLPETPGDQLPAITQNLDKAVQEKLGLSLQIGTAAMPDEAITFESLVEQALDKANRTNKEQFELPQPSEAWTIRQEV